MTIILITGGARSGKSRHAETRTRAFPGTPNYIATAEAFDAEMRQRIETHQARRGPEWQLRQAPLDLVTALTETDGQGPRLVDCLTLWLTNFLAPVDAGNDFPAALPQPWRDARAVLLSTLPALPGEIILISNEVGLGIVPLGSLARLFRDEAGRLKQDLAAACERATFVAAGLPLALKTPQHC